MMKTQSFNMITFKQFINEEYDNWVRYTPSSVAADFTEYVGKEDSKWKARAKTIGARFPIFKSEEQLRHDLDNAKIVNIDDLRGVMNMTKNDSIDHIKNMVKSYFMPRDVDRIIQGITSNAKLPLPIIIKGSKGMWIMAGNTRQATTRVLGHTPKALLVDVSK